MLGAAKNAEEKSKKAMVDAARLADELRAEQDHASSQASSKQSLNNQFGQLEARLADAENAAARGGKAAMAKLENKVHELEAELAGTQARTGEAAKAYQRAEQVQGAGLLLRRGQEEPGQDDRPGLQAAVQDQDLQAADRGGRGDRRPQPCQVPQGPAAARGDLRACRHCRDVRSPVSCCLENLQLTVLAANSTLGWYRPMLST